MKLILSLILLSGACTAAETIRLHPQNPHCFSWRGKPTVLISSAEHYGAVINLGFDCAKYLQALRSDGLNQTRVFSGTFREVPGSFNVQTNTRARLPQRWRNRAGEDLRCFGFSTKSLRRSFRGASTQTPG